jgi:hypothetical protein
MSVMRLTALSFAICSAGSVVASAETLDEAVEEPIIAHASANDDAFTPGLTHASSAGRAIVTATQSVTGARGAKDSSTLDLNGEVQVWGPVRLVLRVDNVYNTARPGIGGAVQFLDERKHGVAASAYFSYKAEGFTEGEGELEGLVAFGKQLGPAHGTLNLAYGQDPEGVERDGEIALGLHLEPIRGLFTGVVGRFRDALGSNGDKGTGILRDAHGGLSATYAIGNFGLTGSAGVAGIKTTTTAMKAGAEAAVTVGTVF